MMRPLCVMFLVAAAPAWAAAGGKCACTCVVKEEGGRYSTRSASGKDREAAGEALKKELGKLRCELSPACEGSC